MTNNEKIADAYASVAEAHEQFVNFLTGVGDIDLEDQELYLCARKIGHLLNQAKKSLEAF